jgi:hypothetical protein
MLVPSACHQEDLGALRHHRLSLPLGEHAAEILHEESAPCTAIPSNMLILWKCPMDVIYSRGCGLDIHKRTVVACMISRAQE